MSYFALKSSKVVSFWGLRSQSTGASYGRKLRPGTTAKIFGSALGSPVQSFCRQGGGESSDENVRSFGAKNLQFLKIYGVTARHKRERGQIFAILCGNLLWTAHK